MLDFKYFSMLEPLHFTIILFPKNPIFIFPYRYLSHENKRPKLGSILEKI